MIPLWDDGTTENMRYRATERYSFGWVEWKAVLGSRDEITPEERFGQRWYAAYKRQLLHYKRMLEQGALS